MRTVAIVALLTAISVCFIGHAAVGSATTVPVSVNDSDEIMVIEIRPNGNADVSVIRTVPIGTQNASAAFNKTAQRYRKAGGQSFDAADSLASFKHAARTVDNESNRSINIIDVTNETDRRSTTGIFYRNFTWTNFVVPPEGNEVVSLNESFTAGGRPWLRSLTADQTLVISVSQGYELKKGRNVNRVENNSWVFTGPRTFQQFDIAYSKQSYPDSGNGWGGGDGGVPDPPISAIALLAVVVVCSIGVFAYLRRQTLLDGLIGDTGSSEPNEVDPPRSTNEHENGAGTESSIVVDSDSDTGSTDRINVELLSDEERVERLLQNNGGRMRQATIVTETGWSDAKVSQLLSAMDENERIEKLRIGRENLISLPNYDPDLDAESDPDHAGND